MHPAGNSIRFPSVNAIRNFVPTRLLRPKIFTREEGVGRWMLRGGRRWSPIAYATAIFFAAHVQRSRRPAAAARRFHLLRHRLRLAAFLVLSNLGMHRPWTMYRTACLSSIASASQLFPVRCLGDDRSALIDLLQFEVAGSFVIGRRHGRADLTLSKHRHSTPAKAGGDPMERSPADPILVPRVLTEGPRRAE